MPFSLLTQRAYAVQRQLLGAGRGSCESPIRTRCSESDGLFAPRVSLVPRSALWGSSCPSPAVHPLLFGHVLAPAVSPSLKARGSVWSAPCNVTPRNVWGRGMAGPGGNARRGKRGCAREVKQASARGC